MRVRIIITYFLLVFGTTLRWSKDSGRKIIILPFINNSVEQDVLHEDLFASCFYLYFDKLENFSAVHPVNMIQYRQEHVLQTVDLYNFDVIKDIKSTYNADFVLGGEFRIANGLLTVRLEDYGNKKLRIKRDFSIKIDMDMHTIVRDIAGITAEAFKQYNPETASLVVNTEYPCTLYVNGATFGKTPLRFSLPAGDYDIDLVYEDELFTETVFKKKIHLDKGTLYDPGQGIIKVLVPLTFHVNVTSTIFCNNIKIGTTDTEYNIPVNNDYIIDFIYTDSRNETQRERRFITTNAGENVLIEHEFKNNIKMNSGTMPFYGKVGEETKILPHTFENLESGSYNVKMLLKDPDWNRDWVIYKEKVILNIAETTIIDKSEFIYRKNWGLCFIPGAAQFYNFEPGKGTIILSIAGLSIAGSILSYYYITQNKKDTFIYDTFKITTIASLGLFGTVYIYSFIDGLITMEHLHKLFFPK